MPEVTKRGRGKGVSSGEDGEGDRDEDGSCIADVEDVRKCLNTSWIC